MKRTQDLSMGEFDLFSRCAEAAAKNTVEGRTGYSIPFFCINRISQTLKFRYEYVSSYQEDKWNWTFDSEEGLSGPDGQIHKRSKEFYVIYKLLRLYFLDDESLLDEMWDWEASQWDSRRNDIDHLYKIKATFLGAHCSGDNHYCSELNEAYLYKVKWVTHRSEINPDFTRVLSQHEHISLTRYSLMYNILYRNVGMTSGQAMGIMRKIDNKINQYVFRRNRE